MMKTMMRAMMKTMIMAITVVVKSTTIITRHSSTPLFPFNSKILNYNFFATAVSKVPA
jgi:hypothetical protein